MIQTFKIKSLNDKIPSNTNDTIYANVLSWHAKDTPFYTLSPYHLKTDGKEEQKNQGGILFENFWQGSKVWPEIHNTQIWAHPNLRGNPKHLWFEYKTKQTDASGRLQTFETHLKDDVIQPEYFDWREKIFSCQKPIRYPNGYLKRNDVQFALLCKDDNTQERLGYLDARKRIYIREYTRLIRNVKEFYLLLEIVFSGKTLVICETDVPHQKIMTFDYLNDLLHDQFNPYGHGLCLARELLNIVNLFSQ